MHLLLHGTGLTVLMATLAAARIVDVFHIASKLPTFQGRWFADETLVDAFPKYFPTEDLQQLTTPLLNESIVRDRKHGFYVCSEEGSSNATGIYTCQLTIATGKKRRRWTFFFMTKNGQRPSFPKQKGVPFKKIIDHGW